jgi:hypothetical protein
MDLLSDESDKLGMYMDVLEKFQLRVPATFDSSMLFDTGKDISDWVASQLEEQGRLVDYP